MTRDEQQPRGDERGAERDNGKIPHMLRRDLRDSRQPLRQQQPKQHAHCGKHAVAGNQDSADVEENRMHQSQNTSSETAASGSR